MTDEHQPDRRPRYTMEEWARARAEDRLSPDPDSEPGEWQKLSDITARLFAPREAAE